MCLDFVLSLFSEAITIILGTLFLFVILFYLVGFLIGAFIGGVALLVLALTNPVTWIFLTTFIIGGCLLLNKRIK